MPRRGGKFKASCSDTKLEKGTSGRGPRRSQLLRRVLQMVHNHDEREPSEWKRLQALVTNMFQRHWEWQEDRRVDLQPARFRYNTAFMANLDVKTACVVASPAVVTKILTLKGVHGHLTAALLAEMQDVRGSASFENCETEFRQGGVEAPVLWGRIAKRA